MKKRDFTLSLYTVLLTKLKKAGYSFYTFEEYLTSQDSSNQLVILRHDIDRKPDNALKMAKIEHENSVRTSYYFRIVKKSCDKKIISEIADLGHEIGYHYENLTETKGNIQQAIELFKDNLNQLRQLYPIKTICMHGSPLSKFDNRKLWEKYNYQDFGIIGEPYFDLNFNKILYLTDTGRKWNGGRENVRDKVASDFSSNFKTTYDIMRALQEKELPHQVLLNIHPQRWANSFLPWFSELVIQNIKNYFKKFYSE